jgi:MFS family permease
MPPPPTPLSTRPRRSHELGAALSVSNFRRYVSGQALSLIGTWVETVAQGLLVLRLTHSAVLLGLTTATRYAPVLLLSPYAGLLVDRFSKRRVLLVTQLGLGLVSLLLGLAVLTHDIALWQVFVLGIAFGTFSAADNPARQAFVSEVVGPSLVRNAVTLNSTLVNVARVLGPTIAAVVVDTVGIGWCFVINAASFLAVIASLLALHTDQLHPITPIPRARGELRDGFHYAAGIPEIIRPLLMMAVIGTFAFEFEVSFPLLAQDTFHGGADAYGWLLGAFGIGAVAGGVYALGRARTGVDRLGRIAVGYAAAMAFLAVAPTLWTAVGAAVLVGVATILFLTTGNATVQLSSDPHYRGRVMALWSVALVGSTPVGAPIIGAVSQALNPRVAIGLGALACVGAAALSRIGRRRPLNRQNSDLQADAVPGRPPARNPAWVRAATPGPNRDGLEKEAPPQLALSSVTSATRGTTNNHDAADRELADTTSHLVAAYEGVGPLLNSNPCRRRHP